MNLLDTQGEYRGLTEAEIKDAEGIILGNNFPHLCLNSFQGIRLLLSAALSLSRNIGFQ